MKIFSKALIVLLFGFSLRVLLACCDCPAEPGKVYYRIDGLSLLTLDNSGDVPYVRETESIPKEAFGIKIQYATTDISSTVFSGGSIFATANACSCIDPERIPGEALTVNITTLDDLDADYPAGSDVTSLFKVPSAGIYYSIDEYINNSDVLQVPEEFFLLTVPDPGFHQFRVDITMPDDRLVSAVTRQVNLE